MADEKVARLKLKRRKVPGKVGLPPPTGLQAHRVPPLKPLNDKKLITSTCWFDGEGLDELHSVWKEVVNAAYPDLKSRNWDSIPSFPECLEKCCEEDKDSRKTEVFTFGQKEFKWTDFPSVTHTKVISVIPQVVDSLPEYLNKESLQSKPIPVITETSKIATTNRTETIRAGHSSQDTPKTSKKVKVEEPKQPRPKNPTQTFQKKGKMKISAEIHSTSISAEPQNLTKASGFKRLFKTNSQGEKECERAPSQGKQTVCLTVDDDISVVQGEHVPFENINEGTASLQSCPMCGLQFAERFTPLEIDSHLAKCLSESAEDIMW